MKHIKKAFVERGFLTVNSDIAQHDDLEDAFARAEGAIFDRLHSVQFGAFTDEQAKAVKALCALLFARSYRMGHHTPRMSRETIDAKKAAADSDRELRSRFRRERGRQPNPGELAELVEQFGQKFVSSGTAQVSGILHMYQRAVAKFDPLHVTLYDAAGLPHGLIISDNPVLLARGQGLIDVDNRERLIAVGDADMIYFPLRRRLGVCLTSRVEPHERIDAGHVTLLNNAMWRSAHSVIGAHPDEDWSAACGGVTPR